MTLDEHASNLGKLVNNLQSLELLIRVYLGEHNGEILNIPSAADSMVPETHVTNYDSLNQLIDKFNATVPAARPDLAIDKRAVELRDALAHGRVLSTDPQPPMRLFKFGRPNNGNVDKTFDEVMNEVWYTTNGNFTHDQMNKVRELSRIRGFQAH